MLPTCRFQWGCIALAYLLLLTPTPRVIAADALLFDNLRAFGTRLGVGDPTLSPANTGG